MTTGYTRQSAAEIQTGSVILAASLNDEYDAIVAFADANSGHNHDGTTGAGAKIPSAGLNGLTSTSSGLIAATGSNTFAARTLTGTANELTVTNGTGASGNPTVSLPSALTFTGKTITGGTFTSPSLSAPTLTGTVIADVIRTSGTSGVDIQNSGGTVVLDIGPNNTTDATFTGLLNINTNQPVLSASNTQTVTNKTFNLTNNTLTGTIAQFNTAVSDADLATLAGTETLTNKTLNLANNTLTGTIAQFNTAVSDADLATLAGTETLTNKTLNLANNTLTGTIAQFNTAVSDADLATIAGTETLTNKTLTTPTVSNPTVNGTISGSATGLQLQSISASVAASALTISASALSLEFRSATLGSGTVTRVSGTPANLVISSGSTLGTVSAVQSRIAVLALNNAGTIELAAVNLAGGVDLFETGLISTTAEGGAGAADSATVIYSTTARSNLAYRVIGYIESTQATAGTWATTPSTIQGAGGNSFANLIPIGPWTAYTPTCVGQANGLTFTNITPTGQYRFEGKQIHCRVKLAISGAPGTGTGYILVGIPSVAVNTAALNDSAIYGNAIGAGFVYDVSATTQYVGAVGWAGVAAGVVILTHAAATPASATVPATLAAGDIVAYDFTLPIT